MGSGRGEGVIGKLGGRAGSPHYWGWIAFAGRSRAILAILRHQRQHQHRDRDHPSHYRSLETFGLFLDLKDTKCSLNQQQHHQSHHQYISRASIFVKWKDPLPSLPTDPLRYLHPTYCHTTNSNPEATHSNNGGEMVKDVV